MSNRIKELRLENNLSQEELAGLVGTSRRMISFYEEGERHLSLNLAIKIADVFKCSLDYMLYRYDYKERPIGNIDVNIRYIPIFEKAKKINVAPDKLLTALDFIEYIEAEFK